MKKKLIQSLLLLIVAVSVGSFVSCKDTDEDLYNELRTKYIQDNATLKQAFDLQIQELEGQIATYQAALDALQRAFDGFKSCECNEDALQALINGINEQIGKINEQIATLTAGLANAASKDDVNAINVAIATLTGQVEGLKSTLDALTASYYPLAAEFASYKTSQDILKDVVDGLKEELEKIKSDIAGSGDCPCDYNYVTSKLAELDAKMKAAETQAKQAYDFAAQALENVNGIGVTAGEALATAQNALSAATSASEAAQKAVTAAELAQQAAEAAGLSASEAKALAEEAKDNASLALQTANTANEVAEKAWTIALSAEGKADKNAESIATLQENARLIEELAKKNEENIAKNAADISDLSGKVQKNADDIAQNAKDIATNAGNIATNAENIQKNADAINEINTQLLLISNNAADALARANEAYAYADANYKLIEGINSTLAGLKAAYDEKFQNLEDATDELKSNLQTLESTVGENSVNIGKLQQAVEDLTTSVGGFTERLNTIESTVGNLQNELAELKGKYENILAQTELLVKGEIATAKAEILQYVFENYVTKEQLDSYATTEQLKDSVASLVERFLTELGKDRERIRANEVDIEWLKGLWADSNEKWGDLDGKFEDLLERVAALESNISEDMKETIKEEINNILEETITEKITEVITTEIIKEGEITEELTNLITNIINEGIEDGDFITEDDVMSIVNGVIAGVGAEGIENLVDLVTTTSTLNGTVSSIVGDVDPTVTNLGTLQSDINDIVNNKLPEINNRLNVLGDSIQNLDSRLGVVEEDVSKLKDDVAALQNALGKQVSSIIVQGTFNPMFGTFNLPVGLQSNALIAFYGIPVTDVEFPTDDDANYVRKNEVLTAKDMEMLTSVGLEAFEAPANLPLLNENGNAGKVYMTINPNTANLEGLKLSLVNTLDEESIVKLSPIRKCNEKLQFGYTRADNGFYVADAYVDSKTVMEEDNGLALTREDISDLYDEVYAQVVELADNFFKPGRQTSLANLTTSIYNVITSLKNDRHGLKCTYTTTDNEGKEKEHSVYSEYNLASTFYLPFNLKWGKDFDYVTMPGYEAISGMLDDIAATLKANLDINVATGIIQGIVENLRMEELKFIDVDLEHFIAKFEARVSSVTLNGVGYELRVPGIGNFEIKFDKNLTAGGSAVAVPDAVAFDEENITEKRATLVIFGDIVSGLKIKMLIPARGGDDQVEAYASLVLSDSYAKAQLNSGMITLAVDGTTYNLAAYSGSNLSITSDCVDFVILDDVVGRDGSVYLPVVLEFTQDVRDLLEQQKDILDNLVKDLNAELDKINSYGGTAWIDDFMDEYLRKYLDQINSDYCFFFNSINRRFGPFIVASNKGKGFRRLSFSKNYPVTMKKADLKLHPTTKNLELIVPLARKHVAVTNVYTADLSANAQAGNADCKAKLQAANTGKLNTVLDGTVRTIDVNGMVPGYVYEVAYSILDFDGNISTIKSYIAVED